MKPYKITLFIFICIGLLSFISAFFPAEGIDLQALTLNFPTISEVLHTPTTEYPLEVWVGEDMMEKEDTASAPVAVRDTALERHLQQLHQPYAIHFPIVDGDTLYRYLDPVFAAFRGADTTLVRVVHYGDSQIEEDRISQVLRRHWQQDFGGQGVGLIPLYQTVQSLTIGTQTQPAPVRYMAFGPKSSRRPQSSYYGPMLQMAVLDTTTVLTVLPRTKQTGLYSAHQFNTLTVISRPNTQIEAAVAGQRQTIAPKNTPMQFTTFHLADSTTNATLTLRGKGDVYGISYTGQTGINVDNVPLRGCSGTIFSLVSAEQMKQYFSQTNTRLILMQFGGNSMPYLTTEKAITNYINSLVSQLQYMQRCAPDARIVFIGPSDMTTRIQGRMQTYPYLADFDRRLMAAVRKQGCAYWSLFQTMGGNGSMAYYVQQGWAGNDYIHFTRKGASQVGETLYNAFTDAYNYYLFRQRQDKIQTPERPIPLVTISD